MIRGRLLRDVFECPSLFPRHGRLRALYCDSIDRVVVVVVFLRYNSWFWWTASERRERDKGQ
jgi:hypothetical protein